MSPARVQLPVCGQELAPRGPRDRQAAPQPKHLGKRKGNAGVTDPHIGCENPKTVNQPELAVTT